MGGSGAEPGPEKVPAKVWDALVQSQVRFNRVPEKVPEKVWEALVQSQVRFNGICGHLIHGNPPEVFPARGFATRFSEKTLRLLGIPPKFISFCCHELDEPLLRKKQGMITSQLGGRFLMVKKCQVLSPESHWHWKPQKN